MKKHYGHFDEERREYVVTDPRTPAPWINYLMGGELTALISQAAGGLAFYREPAEGRLTRYRFNGLPVDSPGFYIYVQDGDTTWNPSFRPTCTPLDSYECRHGLGYTRFTSLKAGIEAQVTYLIPPRDNVFLWVVRLANRSKRARRLDLTTYMEFALHRYTYDVDGFLVCGNQWNAWFDPKVNGIKLDYFGFECPFHGQTIFASSLPVREFDIDRDCFIGSGRTEANPVGLERGLRNTETRHGGRYTCGTLRNTLELEPGGEADVIYRYAVSDRFATSARLLKKYNTLEAADRALFDTRRYWEQTLAAAQVATPDSAMDRMLNTWFPYNTRVTFKYARSISTRHTGSWGALRFRDSMQDALPAVLLYTDEARDRLRLILRTMCADGHCVTSVNPQTLAAADLSLIRSDAAVWGVFTIYEYLAETGDFGFLDEVVPYFDKGEGTVYDHLMRGLRFIARHTGKDGLPDLFSVDWNDGLQVFTVAYTGCQSVMVAQQFVYAARLLEQLAARQGQESDVRFLRRHSARFTRVLNSDVCWDGAWFRRVLGDGLVLGSRENRFAKIFLNTQSWAAIAGTLDPARVRAAMDSAHDRLNTEYGLRLCAPPCKTMPDGKSRYPSNNFGAGENGGIFLHANVWAVIAETMLGRGERAWQYYSQILPPNLSGRDPDRYMNEPYVFTSWIYGPDHERFGTGQLSWLTGGAAWMYLIGLQYILGVKPELDGLRIAPCIPSSWPGYRVSRRWRGTMYDIEVENPDRVGRGRVELEVDGKAVEGAVLAPTRKKRVAVHATLRPGGPDAQTRA